MTFDFSIGGYFSSTNLDIFYRRQELYCKQPYMPGFPAEHARVIQVRYNPAWDKLLQFLEQCKWEKSYHDPETLDGTQWSLSATCRNRFRIRSSGSNAYPADFRKFLRLLNHLLKEAGLENLPQV